MGVVGGVGGRGVKVSYQDKDYVNKQGKLLTNVRLKLKNSVKFLHQKEINSTLCPEKRLWQFDDYDQTFLQ